MGRSPCCKKIGLKKGPWTVEEDQKLQAYVEEHGHGSWRSLPEKAGLQRCGKSCRLRWINYLRPDIKRGKFTLQEEQTIIQLHALLGNRWSTIAAHLPKRTDNEIKNYWNTHLKKRLIKMGIDPVTHKAKNEALLSSEAGQSKNSAILSHMSQWESARLEAEARLARESNLCFREAWNWTKLKEGTDGQLESSTCMITSSENLRSLMMIGSTSGSTFETDGIKEAENELRNLENSLTFRPDIQDMAMSMEGRISRSYIVEEGFTSLLLSDSIDLNFSDNCRDSENINGSDQHGDDKNYWNSILNLVNSPPYDSPKFW